MATYITYMPAGGWGNPPYIDHCLGVISDKLPDDDGRITMSRAEYESGWRAGLRAHRCDTVYDVEIKGNIATLTPE